MAVLQPPLPLLQLGWARPHREHSHGYYLSQNFTYAGGFLFGLSNYIRSSTSASAYTTLWSYTLGEKPANVVLGATTTVSAMLPQFYKNIDTGVWGWYDAKMGATRYEMLYIDGMNMGRGIKSVVFDQSFLWDTQLSISWPLAQNVLSAEVYASATGVSADLKKVGFGDLAWYFSAGAGIKLKVPGFPLGLYLVKAASYMDNTFSWIGATSSRARVTPVASASCWPSRRRCIDHGSEEQPTPMMVQYRQIKEQHTDSILFFRLGDF